MNDCSVPLPTRENVGVRKAEPAVPTYADHSMKGSALLRNALDKRDSTAGRRSVVGNLHDVARQHSSVSANQPLLSSLFDISRQQPPRASETNSKDDGRVVLVKREGAGAAGGRRKNLKDKSSTCFEDLSCHRRPVRHRQTIQDAPALLKQFG